MKAYRRCINPDCDGKKKNYKAKDQYCTLCGQPLAYVCADCGKVMEDGSEKYCLACKTKREEKAADRKAAVMAAKGAVAAAAGAAVVGVGKGAKMVKDGGVIVDAGKKVLDKFKK